MLKVGVEVTRAYRMGCKQWRRRFMEVVTTLLEEVEGVRIGEGDLVSPVREEVPWPRSTPQVDKALEAI